MKKNHNKMQYRAAKSISHTTRLTGVTVLWKFGWPVGGIESGGPIGGIERGGPIGGIGVGESIGPIGPSGCIGSTGTGIGPFDGIKGNDSGPLPAHGITSALAMY